MGHKCETTPRHPVGSWDAVVMLTSLGRACSVCRVPRRAAPGPGSSSPPWGPGPGLASDSQTSVSGAHLASAVCALDGRGGSRAVTSSCPESGSRVSFVKSPCLQQVPCPPCSSGARGAPCGIQRGAPTASGASGGQTRAVAGLCGGFQELVAQTAERRAFQAAGMVSGACG